jgi:MFS family permease
MPLHQEPISTSEDVGSTSNNSSTTLNKQLHNNTKAADEDTGNDKNDRQLRGFKWILLCLSLYISSFVFGLDTTIAADLQGSIIQEFGHVEQLAWIGAGFPLGSVATIFPTGISYTQFNNKWVYITSLVLFEIGSTLCAAAPNMNTIIIGRVIAGSGGAGLFIGALNYFSAMTSASERGLYISLISLCWGAGAVLGPIVGGAFSVSSATWRWGFYINPVIAAVTAPVYLVYLPSLHPTTGKTILQRVKQLDFVGFVLCAAMWASFALAGTMAGGPWSWNDARTIVTWVVFALLLVTFVLQQWLCILTTPAARSFPVHLLRCRTQGLLCVTTSANMAACFCIMYFTPLYFQFVHGDGALVAAVRLLPYVAFTVVTNILTSWCLPRIQYYMVIYVVAGMLTTVGSGLFVHFLNPSTPEGVIYGLLVLLGIATGLTFSLGFAIATIKADRGDVRHAIILQDVCQLGSSTVALVAAGQVFQSCAVANLARVLHGHGFSSDYIRGAVSGAQSALLVELTGSLRDSAIGAITDAMQRTMILSVVAGALLLCFGACLPCERLFPRSEEKCISG